MKAKFIQPKNDRDIVITMKESEAIEITQFIGGTCSSSRKKLCTAGFLDIPIRDLYATLSNTLESEGD